MIALLAKAGHAGSALTWPTAFVLVAGLTCFTVVIVVLIVVTAWQGAKR